MLLLVNLVAYKLPALKVFSTDRVKLTTGKSGMRSRERLSRLRLRLRLRLRVSISVPTVATAPAPSKMAIRLQLRLRAKYGDSGLQRIRLYQLYLPTYTYTGALRKIESVMNGI